MMKCSLPALSLCFVLSALFAGSSQAQLVFLFEQAGQDITVTASGTADPSGLTLTGLPFNGTSSQIRNIPENGTLWSIDQPNAGVYAVPNPYFLYSNQFSTVLGTSTGDVFGLFTANIDFQNLAGDAFLYFEEGFTGGPVNGKLTIPDVQLDTLGLNEGVLTWGPNADQQLIITTVPEPTSLALLGLGGLLLTRRRRD